MTPMKKKELLEKNLYSFCDNVETVESIIENLIEDRNRKAENKKELMLAMDKMKISLNRLNQLIKSF